MAIDYTTPDGQVRLLINDTQADQVFGDNEILGFLSLEGDSVKRAAAQALDTIADDEALTGKVIRTQDVGTDGPKVADSLRKRATELRRQADDDAANGEDGFFFDVVSLEPTCAPELTETWWP